MELAIITAKQVVILYCLILAGFAGVKSGVIKPEAKKAFSNLLLYLAVPAMVIHSYISKADRSVLARLPQTFAFSVLAMLAGLAITMLCTCRIKGKERPILRFACIFSNAAYMGFPLIEALFGAEGLIYASVYVTVFNILLWTVGFGMITGTVKPKEVVRTVCTNPVLIAVVIGLVIYLCQIPVPEVIEQPLALIGNMNTPLSMIITGMMIAGSNLAQMLCDRRILSVVGIRMLLIPAVCFALFFACGFSGMAAGVVLLLEACPSAAITSVFAVQYSYDEEFAAGSVPCFCRECRKPREEVMWKPYGSHMEVIWLEEPGDGMGSRQDKKKERVTWKSDVCIQKEIRMSFRRRWIVCPRREAQ